MTEATVAFVTGGAGGIGSAASLDLARVGMAVAVGYLSDDSRAEEIVAKVSTEGVASEPVAVDLRNERSIDDAFGRIERRLGAVKVLVNNAGMSRDGLAVKYATAVWDETFNVNLRGAFLCSRRALPGMLRARWGRIVNIASAAALRGNAGQSAYSASKTGLLGLTRSLAREVGSRGITVNAVCPGFVHTKMTASQTEEVRRRWIEMTPAGRLGTPDEVASVIAFLSGQEASYVNGAVVPVDGGLTA